MTRLSRLTSLASTLSFKLFFVLFLSVVLMFGVYVAVSSRYQRRVFERQVAADAARHGDLIIQGLYADMLRNEREHSYAEIEHVGAEPGIEVIRVYNKDGEIRISSLRDEIGSKVDLRAEACYVCHSSAEPLEAVPTNERARIYEGHDGYRILGYITPIPNDESCARAGCHAHSAERSVLGVLDVQMSMQLADEGMAASQRQAVVSSVVVISILMLLTAGIVYRGVHKPTRALRRGTQALARGDLDTQIDLNRSDELGQLARSFNEMASSLKIADGELRRWSKTLEDRVREKTEELEQIHRSMMQVEKSASLGKMAATVAHELNNPLSGILTYAKLISKKVNRLALDGPEREQVLASLDLIQSESLRCGNIVRDLLTYARESSPEFQRARLHDLVERAVKVVDHHIALKDIHAHKDLTLEDDEVVCDPDQVIQAMIALMINAVEAMPEGGELRIRTWEGPTDPYARVCLSIEDTGVGIFEDMQSRIFDPFFSTKEETKGVGLGLAVVYGIVQRHEGEIAVSSTPGQGATFTIQMPRDPKRAASARGGRIPATHTS